MSKKATKGNRGGYRPGSGKKYVGVNRITVSIPMADVKEIRQLNPQKSMSAFFQVATKRYLQLLKKKGQELALTG